LAKLLNFRERGGDFFNALEENRSLRRTCLGVLAVIVSLAAASAWLLPRWRERSSIQVTRQWLAADKLDRAGESVREMLARAPGRVEAWQVAADYSLRMGQKQKAMAYLHQAAALQPAEAELTLDWAAAAVVAGNLDEAEGALSRLPAETRARSARVERLSGEVARQRGDLAKARGHFESAVRLGGALAENEIPLAIVLVGIGSVEERRQGSLLLERWRGDPVWGADALRALLADAFGQDDRPSMAELAEELLNHLRSERADVLNSLLALSKSAPDRFAAALSEIERRWVDDPAAVSELVAWLSGVGQGREAVRWLGTLPRPFAGAPPIVAAWADALRVLGDWPALRAITEKGDWAEGDFLRQAYLALAERSVGETEKAERLWRGLQESSRLNGGRALFLAGVFYTWDWQKEAVELWWVAAEQPGIAVTALGSLARHYQVQRDADGLYQAFRRLHEIKADDRRITNNYAYFAALTGRNLPMAERLARDNRETVPDEPAYVATHAFVLYSDGRKDAALALLPGFLAAAPDSPALAFTGGLLLASTGRSAEAKGLLEKVDERSLTLREVELLKAARTAVARP
jgi:tetratricopeptide (TPR) repeat protein